MENTETPRKTISELTSAKESNSTYDTLMSGLSGLSKAQSGKTGAERAMGLGQLGYVITEAIQSLLALF